MSVIVVPTTGYPAAPVSLADFVSFCVQDDGSGGNVYLNGLGVGNAQVSNAVDLKTVFTNLSLPWRSTALLRAFRAIPDGTAASAMSQFIQNLDVSYYFLNGVGNTGDLGFTYLIGLSGGGALTPYLSIAGPGAAGIWRVDIKLRHSVTN